MIGFTPARNNKFPVLFFGRKENFPFRWVFPEGKTISFLVQENPNKTIYLTNGEIHHPLIVSLIVPLIEEKSARSACHSVPR